MNTINTYEISQRRQDLESQANHQRLVKIAKNNQKKNARSKTENQRNHRSWEKLNFDFGFDTL